MHATVTRRQCNAVRDWLRAARPERRLTDRQHEVNRRFRALCRARRAA